MTIFISREIIRVFILFYHRLAMTERDSFGLTYSRSLNKSPLKEIQERQSKEEEERLSPNKQNMLQTFRENILKPLESEKVISSLTSVDKQNVSLPNISKFSKEAQQEENEDKENKQSMPTQKEIKRISSKLEEKQEELRPKSKILMPRASMKEALTMKIADASDFLAKGVELEKYCYGKEKIEDVVLYFSEDMQFMALYIFVQQRIDIVPMADCIGVTAGLKTARFQAYLMSKVLLDEEKCFSLLFRDRSYDFMAKNKDHRDRIVNDIKFLFKGVN